MYMEFITQIMFFIVLAILLFLAYKNRQQLTASLYDMCHDTSNIVTKNKRQIKDRKQKVNIDNISQISDISLETPHE